MNHRFSILLALVVACATAHADWGQFRGPNGNGWVAGNEKLPVALGEKTLAWKAELPGRGLGTPIVIGERVFVTAATGPDQNHLKVLCFSAADGKEQWRRSFWATGRTMCHKKTCVAAPTPASDGKRLYAFWSSNDVVCLDFDGNLVWLRGLTHDYPNASNSLGMSSSPIIVGGTLVVQVENDSESFAAGLDLESGENKWKIDRPKKANWTSPLAMTVGGQEVVVLHSTKGVTGLSPVTGSVLWNYAKGSAAIPSGAAAGDTLYVPSKGLTALRPAAKGGEVETLWNSPSSKPATASPLVVGDTIYFTNSAGVLTAADRSNGERRWRIRAKGPFSGSPVAADNGHLYLVNEEGLMQVVDLSGEEGKVVSKFELGETILGTPAIADDALYVRSDGHLWKFAAPALSE